jgi:hypothetical protein
MARRKSDDESPGDEACCDPPLNPRGDFCLKRRVAGASPLSRRPARTLNPTRPAAAWSNASESAAAKRSSAISPLMRTASTSIAQAATTPLPEAATEATKHHLLDTLAAMVWHAPLLPGQRADRYVKTLGGIPEACVPGTRIVTNVVNAAMTGGMLAHADETDDQHALSVLHPGAGMVPAALAMAEREKAGGTRMLRAIALGYDIGVRVALSLGGAEFTAAGRDTHGFGCTFGAAAAAASLARFNADQVRHSLSYAAQQASGVSNIAQDLEHIQKAFQYGGMPGRNGRRGDSGRDRLDRRGRRSRAIRILRVRDREGGSETPRAGWARLRDRQIEHQALAGGRPDPGSAWTRCLTS